MSWQVLRLHRGKVEEPFAHTPVSPCSQTPGLSHHMLPTLSAVPQNHCPLLCQDRSLTHRGIHCCWCGHTCLHRASTAATSMAGDVSKVCQTGTSLRTFLLTLFARVPSCNSTGFVHVNLYPVSKHLLAIPALSTVFVASRRASSFAYNQPETRLPKHLSQK